MKCEKTFSVGTKIAIPTVFYAKTYVFINCIAICIFLPTFSLVVRFWLELGIWKNLIKTFVTEAIVYWRTNIAFSKKKS